MSSPVSIRIHLLNDEILMPNDELMPMLEWMSRAAARERSKMTRPQIASANRFNGAHFVTPHFDAGTNLVADFACAGEAFFVCAAKRSWI